ncbi:MAG: V-type ATP synthase subunit B [Treponema sp.]
MKGIEYRGVQSVDGPVVAVKRTENAFYNETVCVRDKRGEKKIGRVIDLSKDAAVVQIFGDTTGIDISSSTFEFLDEPLRLRVGEGLLGRIFNGLGEPLDGYPPIISSEMEDVNGSPINPYSRDYPHDFIQTGISAIDGMNSLVRGQKLPIFSGNGLPHNKLAAQIIRQAKLRSGDSQFVMVFAGMGIKYDVARFFTDSFEASGVLSKVVMFQSFADAPSIERIMTPRSALTAAEYLAFKKGMHVLVVMTDMTNYCEALREISTTRGEVPGRKGYPGYLYSDLAELYERAGKIKSSEGSVTQIPILTMPNDDISHPIPDLTGYITEGQIVLDRELDQKGLYPAVSALPSLSRLMKDGIGSGITRDDHANVSSQLFAAYSKVKSIRNLAAIIGDEELSSLDRNYLKFGDILEREFFAQGEYEDRTIEQTLEIGWKALSALPQSELYRIEPRFIQKYLSAGGAR